MAEPSNAIPGDDIGGTIHCRACKRPAIERVHGWWCAYCRRFLTLRKFKWEEVT